MKKICFIFIFLLMPFVMYANGGDQRIIDNLYFINLSRAPFTPRVGVKTSFLASFVDIQKDKLIADDLIVDIRISKLGRAGTNKRDFIFRKNGMAVKGGILELPYTFTESGLHEIFFDFAFASNPQKVYEAPDFLIDVQNSSSTQIQNRDIIFGIMGGALLGFAIGWFMRRHYA
jgi:hypothetical protein